MPYFSNDPEADMWQADNCGRGDGCVHEPPGCPLLSVCLRFNDEQCAPGPPAPDAERGPILVAQVAYDTGKADGLKAVLEALVPTGDDGFAKDCPFFKEATCSSN